MVALLPSTSWTAFFAALTTPHPVATRAPTIRMAIALPVARWDVANDPDRTLSAVTCRLLVRRHPSTWPAIGPRGPRIRRHRPETVDRAGGQRSGPRIGRMSTAPLAQSERGVLCDLFTDLGPEAPTLCAGWTTADLAAHLVARERRPDSGPGLVWPPLAGHTDKVRRSIRDRTPWVELVATVRRGPPVLLRRRGRADEHHRVLHSRRGRPTCPAGVGAPAPLPGAGRRPVGAARSGRDGQARLRRRRDHLTGPRFEGERQWAPAHRGRRSRRAHAVHGRTPAARREWRSLATPSSPPGCATRRSASDRSVASASTR